jgi:hypothetical protein
MSPSLRVFLLLAAGCATLDDSGPAVHWPLGSAHQALDCGVCHVDGLGVQVDGACAACHEGDRPLGHFAGECGTCHPPTVWADGRIDHAQFTRFPVPHRGVSACGDCHLGNDGYASFSCIDCHEHSRANTDHEHDELGSRYSYENEKCLDCHPDGEADD